MEELLCARFFPNEKCEKRVFQLDNGKLDSHREPFLALNDLNRDRLSRHALAVLRSYQLDEDTLRDKSCKETKYGKSV